MGDLAPPAQAKLLRVLEERTVTRLGENQPKSIDVRVVAATHQPLERLVEEGKFRSDLLYRLRVIHLKIPALRDRREDILPLAIHFLQELGDRHARRIESIREDARRRSCPTTGRATCAS